MREVKRLLRSGRRPWDCEVAALESASRFVPRQSGPTCVCPEDLRLIQWMTGALHTGTLLSRLGARYQAQADGHPPLPQIITSKVFVGVPSGLNRRLPYQPV